MALNNFAHRKIDLVEDELGQPSAAPKKIKIAIDYIQRNLERKILLAELADLVEWNKFHFSRVFKRYMECTPYEYVIQQRIHLARSLLSGTKQPIPDIAQTVGYDSHSHFSQIFKQRTGLTPESFRNLKSTSQ